MDHGKDLEKREDIAIDYLAKLCKCNQSADL